MISTLNEHCRKLLNDNNNNSNSNSNCYLYVTCTGFIQVREFPDQTILWNQYFRPEKLNLDETKFREIKLGEFSYKKMLVCS